jgi:epoxide hydrolase 4
VLPPDLEDAFTTTGPVRLHFKAAGQGRPVVLLHGFPDFWYGWRRQLGPLVQNGYRVVAPDLRGYNLSDKPREVGAYAVDVLASDVLQLADELWPGEKISLVGHDWGAAVAWWIGITYPHRLDRLVIVNVPHPAVFEQYIRRPSQLLKSWYILFFQLPRLPEWALSSRDCYGLSTMLRQSSHEGAFTEADLQQYRRAWKQPRALTAMLHWYRAAVRYRAPLEASLRVTVPTLVFWGNQDVALSSEMAEPSRELCDDGWLVQFEHASHWPHLEEWRTLDDILIRFLEGGTAAVDISDRWTPSPAER